jgi:two-component system alkaline phosphatase synthesis response regulator PhoP
MNESKHILVIEDDLSILMGLEDNLKEEGYKVTTANNGNDGLDKAVNLETDLILLDIMLPGINGFEVCKKIRLSKPLLPIIMLTARSLELDKITGLDFGADDYITKPFSLSELLARIRARLRSSHPLDRVLDNYEFDNVKIDFNKLKIFVGKREVKFTKKEFDIMKYFINHKGHVVHRHDLLNHVWGYNKLPSTRTVDNFILDIRKKIEKEPSDPKYIISISGAGYRFDH